jgi:RNA polymerase sigma factor (sigma-70 family)
MGAIAAPISIPRARTRVIPLAMLSDESLAKLAGDGDEAAFAALFNRYRASLSRYCRSILRDTTDAEDAFQNTMVSALRSLRREDLSGRVKPWLYRIAHNESISVIRRRHPEESLVEDLPDDVAAGLDDEARDRLGQLFTDLRSLPDQQRSALVMRELVGLDYSEIAGALVISSVAARKAVYEARLSLGMLDAGRASNCTEIRSCISEGDRRMLRSRQIRAHLRACSDCSSFERSIRRRQHTFSLIPVLPGGPLIAALGQGAAGTAALGGVSAAGAGSTAGGGLALKCLGICAIFAAAGSGLLAVGRLGVSHGAPGSAAAPRVGHIAGASAGRVSRDATRGEIRRDRQAAVRYRPAGTDSSGASTPTTAAPSGPRPGHSFQPSLPVSASLPAPAVPTSVAPRSSGGPVSRTLAGAGHTVTATIGTVKTVGSAAGAAADHLVVRALSATHGVDENPGATGAVGGLISGAQKLLK